MTDRREGRPLCAVLSATARSLDGGPAALLPVPAGGAPVPGGTTLVRRLAVQLQERAADPVTVLVAGSAERDVRLALSGLPVPPAVITVDGAAHELAVLAGVADVGGGRLLVARADVATHGELLGALLDDPRVRTALLVGPVGPPEPPVRAERGRVLSVGAPGHRVGAATASARGVLVVDDADRAPLGAVARALAALPPPPGDAAADPVAALAMGLVRSQVPVTAVSQGRFGWGRPADGAAAAALLADLDGADEDRIRLDAAVKGDDGFFTTFFVSPYSRFLARAAARRGLTPNQVTTVSLLLGVAAAVAFGSGQRAGLVAGAVLLQLAFTADCVDGQLARYTRRFTPLGGWLDAVFDRAKEYAVLAGLAVGSSRGWDDGVWVLACCALLAQTARHAVDFCYADASAPPPPTVAPLPLDRVDDGLDPAADPVADPRPDASAAAALHGWRRLDRVALSVYPRKVIAFPIGERFALISLTAAIWTPRVTLTAYLVWLGVAAAYGIAGKVLRSLAGGPAGQQADAVRAYRDDGPLAALLTGAAARLLPAAPAPLSRLGWLVPPLLRLVEYGGLVLVAVLDGADRALPATYALLAVLAFRHYDLVYRRRQQHAGPPGWVAAVGGGWDVRLVVAALAAASGILVPVLVVVAAALGAVYVTESIVSWVRSARPSTAPGDAR